MAARITITIVALVLLLGVGLPVVWQGSHVRSDSPGAAREPVAPEWAPYEAEDGGTLSMPAPPRRRDERRALGKDAVTQRTSEARVAGVRYALSSFENPAELLESATPAELLEAALASTRDNPRVQVERLSELEVEGRPARELVFRSGTPGRRVVTHARFVLDGDRTHVLQVSGDPDAVDPEDVRHFLESLRLP